MIIYMFDNSNIVQMHVGAFLEIYGFSGPLSFVILGGSHDNVCVCLENSLGLLFPSMIYKPKISHGEMLGRCQAYSHINNGEHSGTCVP